MTRIARAWKIEENNGDLGIVKISYPNSAISGVFVSPRLVISSDGTFSGGTTTTVTGSLVLGNWEYLVNLSDGGVISFGQIGDIVPPVFSSFSIASGALLPVGNATLTIGYSDTGSAVNPASFSGKLYSWDATGSLWNTTNLAPTYMTISGATTTSTGRLTVVGLPFGKYRFDISVADTVGNIAIQSMTYYIDAIDWSVSSDTYNI